MTYLHVDNDKKMPKLPDKTIPAHAQRLRQWRKHQGLNQIEMAQRLGVDVGVLRKYENGVNYPGGRFLETLGKAGLNLNWLLLGAGAMFEQPGLQGIDAECSFERRMHAIKELLGDLCEDTRSSALDEFFSRLQEKKRVANLENRLSEMEKATKRAS